jgi:DNA-binding NtrC family response regulator
MPETNGRALAKTLTAIRPEMKVLYTSGYEYDACVEQGELEAGYPFLEKPFTRSALAKRIRELLDPPLS